MLVHVVLQVVLVVIDSVTFHFRQDWPDMGRRARLLAVMAQQAMAVAESRGVAVVYMNQVGGRGREGRGKGGSWGGGSRRGAHD